MAQNFHQDVPKDVELRSKLESQSAIQILEQLRVLDPVRAAAIHPNDRFRLTRALEIVILTGRPVSESFAADTGASSPFTFTVVKIEPPREVLRQRIAQRAAAMMTAGLIDEVQALLKSGIDPQCKPMQSIGYRQVVEFLNGTLGKNALVAAIATATSQFAKRQGTWFRKMPAEVVLSKPDVDTVLAIL